MGESVAIVSDCGTSYAAPFAAKCLAHLDAAIEGESSRETLHALMVHNAQIPPAMIPKQLQPFAPHLVGFGMPCAGLEMLDRDPHEATIVIASRLPPDQQIVLPFAWPPSLVVGTSKCRWNSGSAVRPLPVVELPWYPRCAPMKCFFCGRPVALK